MANKLTTIPVVEDDPAVRGLVIRLLQKRGYQVLEADSGSEGLERYLERRDRVDLVLTDVIMPRMLGTEMIREIQRVDSNVRVMYMTGHAPDAAMSESDADAVVLLKPFTPAALVETVEKCLAA